MRSRLSDEIRDLLGFDYEFYCGGLVLHDLCRSQANDFPRMPNCPLFRVESLRLWKLFNHMRMGHPDAICLVPGYDSRRHCAELGLCSRGYQLRRSSAANATSLQSNRLHRMAMGRMERMFHFVQQRYQYQKRLVSGHYHWSCDRRCQLRRSETESNPTVLHRMHK
jgi:hypothetical protein